MKDKMFRSIIIGTAFLEGIAVLVVEIAGARALAPFYGTSLKVWTAQITATLLFLALGYGVGGQAAKKSNDNNIPVVFAIAGLWLIAFPFFRSPILEIVNDFYNSSFISFDSVSLGIAVGSFTSSSFLFGPPLLALGAVSPLLIDRLSRTDNTAGSAAGTLFFVNTIGGLTGGWLTALWLVPNFPLRLSLGGTGVALILLALFWGMYLKKLNVTKIIGCVLAVSIISYHTFGITIPDHRIVINGQLEVLHRKQTDIGLVQIVEWSSFDQSKPVIRTMLLDGAVQGSMNVDTGLSNTDYTVYQNVHAYLFNPNAKNALVIGMGAGLIGKQLIDRGVEVTTIEVEPAVVTAAYEYFAYPRHSEIIVEDGRTFLNRTDRTFDLVFLDAFSGENSPWYLLTHEALSHVHRILNPGGIFLVNTIALKNGSSPGVERLESVMLQVFNDVRVFTDDADLSAKSTVNTTLVAGNKLVQADLENLPIAMGEHFSERLYSILSSGRTALGSSAFISDDWNDIDYADANVRSLARQRIIQQYGARYLTD